MALAPANGFCLASWHPGVLPSHTPRSPAPLISLAPCQCWPTRPCPCPLPAWVLQPLGGRFRCTPGRLPLASKSNNPSQKPSQTNTVLDPTSPRSHLCASSPTFHPHLPCLPSAGLPLAFFAFSLSSRHPVRTRPTRHFCFGLSVATDAGPRIPGFSAHRRTHGRFLTRCPSLPVIPSSRLPACPLVRPSAFFCFSCFPEWPLEPPLSTFPCACRRNWFPSTLTRASTRAPTRSGRSTQPAGRFFYPATATRLVDSRHLLTPPPRCCPPWQHDEPPCSGPASACPPFSTTWPLPTRRFPWNTAPRSTRPTWTLVSSPPRHGWPRPPSSRLMLTACCFSPEQLPERWPLL